MSDYQPLFSPQRRIPTPQQPQVCTEVWRLQRGDRAEWCQLRDHSKNGGGWELQIFENGRLLFRRRCVNERGARYIAEKYRNDLLRAGWLLSHKSGGA